MNKNYIAESNLIDQGNYRYCWIKIQKVANWAKVHHSSLGKVSFFTDIFFWFYYSIIVMTASVFLKDDRCNHVGLASKQKCKEAELIRLGQIIHSTGSDLLEKDTQFYKLNFIKSFQYNYFNLVKMRKNRTCWIYIKVSDCTLIHIEYRWKSFQVANGQVWEKSHFFKFNLCHWWKCVF